MNGCILFIFGPINTKLRDSRKLDVLICSLIPSFPPCDSGVTVIWASHTLMIMESPSHITFVIWVKVRVRTTGDEYIIRILGMGMPKTRDAHITVTPAIGLLEETNFDPVSCATSSQPIK